MHAVQEHHEMLHMLLASQNLLLRPRYLLRVRIEHEECKFSVSGFRLRSQGSGLWASRLGFDA
jgi:hypothetical protein